MTTAIVSDLHLATRFGKDVARRPPIRRRLLEALAGAEQVVLLGDVLELRERPVHEVMAETRPFFEELAEAVAGARVVIVPGNHDHQLAAPWLERRRLRAPGEPLALENVVKPGREGAIGALARRMPGVELLVAYPGLWLGEGVYATHGHYLDCHLTVPRLECLAASVMKRIAGRSLHGGVTADDYEAALAPLYALLYQLAQAAPASSRGEAGVEFWTRVHPPHGRRTAGSRLLGSVVLPAAVTALNRVGLGPFNPDISALDLRRAGLRAMGEVIGRLRIEAEHVIFGHTHRAGPFPGDHEGWQLAGGTRLVNSGSWVYEPAFLERPGARSPYWPGTLLRVDAAGKPELVTLLADLTPAQLAGEPLKDAG